MPLSCLRPVAVIGRMWFLSLLDRWLNKKKHRVMLGISLLFLVQAATAQTPPAKEVVVVGRRPEKELADCLAHNCPPARDIELSLQAAVDQFADSRYDDARHSLQASLGRNRKHVAELPGPVSSLYATLATVAEHQGDADLWVAAARDNVLVLRRYAGETDTATLQQEFALADTLVGVQALIAADAQYQMIRQRAMQAGKVDIASAATFRRAWLALASDRPDDALARADEAVATAGANAVEANKLRAIVRARVAMRKGRVQGEAAVNALAASLRQSADVAPRLLYQQPIADINPPVEFQMAQSSQDGKLGATDVGYWIRPDGRTADIEILRNDGLPQWKPLIVQQVRSRRYVPLDLPPGNSGIYRIDRFTVRGTLQARLGSRIPQRAGNLAVRVVDLTEADRMSSAHRASARAGERAEDGS